MLKSRTPCALVLLFALALAIVSPACAAPVTLFDAGFDAGHSVGITHDPRDGRTGALAADMLARDLTSLGAPAPSLPTRLDDCPATCIVIGRIDSPMIRDLARRGGIDLSALAGQWERHARAVVRADRKTYVLIAGSDMRGAIYGVVDLSRQLGISPWAWWADVTPRPVARLAIDDAPVFSRAPSVKYRGIFLNDEDWGLQPWAARTLDPKTGNIGPKTYARVFELMWRLKANLLWPAMHSVSTPFYGDPGNPPLARDYAIVVGTSHAEPMMRNNLREWDAATRGVFDFTTNAAGMKDYWRERVAQSKAFETIYTVGLRGIHDGPMQGANDTASRRAILENVVGLQRGLLADAYRAPPSTVPQVYVAYHELQEAYDDGLTLPDDVTLMWADDNYGYLRRLSTPAERRRAGGAGIYYHLSYWGRPHDYLWLGTTHPALIHEEMSRAWSTQARRMWVVNVGDIKPIEYLTQYFLDLAFDTTLFERAPRDHLRDFMAETFGADQADALADIMLRYYDLAFERRPEFMGFGQTEWVTPNRPSDYVQSDGEEAQARLAAYAALVARTQDIAARIAADRRDAFFELVLYPVRAAAKLNERILKLDLAALYARQGRASANAYVDQARTAHAAIVADTQTYNRLRDGKWAGMMDMAPRQLPVFEEPSWPRWSPSTRTGCAVAYWGAWMNDENTLTFTQGRVESKPLTLFGYAAKPASWQVTRPAPGFVLSHDRGDLTRETGYEQRMALTYDGQAKAADLAITCGGEVVPVHVQVLPPAPAAPAEIDRIITLPATAGSHGPDWQVFPGLGSLGASIGTPSGLPAAGSSALTYRFSSVTAGGARIRLVALPTHPVYPGKRLRLTVAIDDGAARTVDVATSGRSDEWRQNVLTNSAQKVIAMDRLAPGVHRLTLRALDPGVILDRIQIEFDGARALYGPPRAVIPY